MGKQDLFCKTAVYNQLKPHEPLFGGWRIVSFIGSGVYGCVFKMKRFDLGHEFISALKVIPLTRALDRDHKTIESLREAMSKESQEIVHLYGIGAHQNVVAWLNHQVFEQVEENSVTALIAVMMEYMPRSLADELKDGPMAWKKAFGYLADCLKGLSHIHSNKILHRDIKPENIFVSYEDVAKIGDFGVARKISDASQAETRVGTPLYIAPEVLRDTGGHGYDFRVDLYSLGLVAYEMLLGVLPFHEESEGNKASMVKRRLSGETIRLPSSLPPGVAQTLLGALAFDPAQRFARAEDFLRAVEKTLRTDGQETTLSAPRPAPAPARPQESFRSSRDADMGGTWPGASSRDPMATRPMMSSESFEATKFHRLTIRELYRNDFSPANAGTGDKEFRAALFLMAALGCGLQWYLQKNTDFAALGFVAVYILAPVACIFFSPRNSQFTAVFFGLSMFMEGVLYLGSLQTSLDSMSLALNGLYIGFLLVLPLAYLALKKMVHG